MNDEDNLGLMLGIDAYVHDTHVGGVTEKYAIKFCSKPELSVKGRSDRLSLGKIVFNEDGTFDIL